MQIFSQISNLRMELLDDLESCSMTVKSLPPTVQRLGILLHPRLQVYSGTSTLFTDQLNLLQRNISFINGFIDSLTLVAF